MDQQVEEGSWSGTHGNRNWPSRDSWVSTAQSTNNRICAGMRDDWADTGFQPGFKRAGSFPQQIFLKFWCKSLIIQWYIPTDKDTDDLLRKGACSLDSGKHCGAKVAAHSRCSSPRQQQELSATEVLPMDFLSVLLLGTIWNGCCFVSINDIPGRWKSRISWEVSIKHTL